MSSNKYDPLEAAKVAPKGPKKPPPVIEVAEPKVEDVKAPPPPTPPLIQWMVKETKRISWNGCVTWLQEGAILDPRGYGGDSGLDKLRAQGVVLELLS